MTCNRAQEIDLLSFFADPRAAGLREFRDHYPVCADCSAEVHAWSEVDTLLREASTDHPAGPDLLRFEAEPGSFDSSRRAQLASHLEGCASCRDEVGAIRSFVASQSSRSPAPATDSVPEAPSLLERLRAALWSPAFAYGLLVVLCVPLLSDYWSQGPTATFERVEDLSAPDAKATPKPSEEIRSDAVERRAEPVPPPQPESRPASPPKPDDASEREGLADRAQDFRQRRRERVAQEAAGPVAMEAEATDSALRSSASAKRRAPPVSVQREEDRYRIRIRNELSLQSGQPVELRLIQADGARALLERVKAEDGVFEIRVPATWLTDGTHQIELRDVDGDRVLARYPLSIP